MSMYALQDALLSDPDLESIPEDERAKTIQALFALTGCDFTSFFPESEKLVSSTPS